MDYKKAFYSKLEDCYLGVKIKDFHQGNIAKSANITKRLFVLSPFRFSTIRAPQNVTKVTYNNTSVATGFHWVYRA